MNQKGFSLVELQTCCAIVAILAAVGYPCFTAAKKAYALNEEIRLLYGYLQSAKLEAIKSNSYVVFQIIPGGYTTFVDNGAGAGKSGDWVRQIDEKKLVDHRYQEGISLSRTTFTGNRTRFNGRVAIKAGRVILANASGSQTQVVMSTVGRLRIEKL